MFIGAVWLYKNDWEKIANHIKSKSQQAVRRHWYSFEKQVIANPDIEGIDIIALMKPYAGKFLVWTEEETNRFYQAIKIHANNWPEVAKIVGTKTAVQCKAKKGSE